VHRVGLAQLRRGEFPFTGWENYGRVLEDPLFFVAIKNTLIFTVVTVGSEIVLAVAIALLINQAGLWTSRVTRLLILLPYAVPPIANGLIWTFLYSFQFGYLNRILFSAGLIDNPINWAGNPATALYAVSVPYVWRTLPFAIILVHAALQGIPRELYEQAAIDGANAWHRFTKITLPMLRQIIAIILILRTAFAFAVFEEILAITQGGPGDATWVAAWYSYKVSFAPPNNFGMGAASAFILALMVGLMALAYMRLVYRRVTL
jgi:multiple sugar transport system permease protein